MLAHSPLRSLLVLLLSIACPIACQAEQDLVSPAVSKAVAYLDSAQAEDGSFSSHLGPAITGLVATGLIKTGRSIDDPMVAKALSYLKGYVQDDGGIYSPGSTYRNYETCVAIQCFKEAAQAPGATESYADLLDKAEKFVKDLQWDDQEGHDISSTSYGGAGYGKHRRPDLSNTSYLVDALHSLGRDSNDPAMQRALAFVSRTQNLETEHNNTPFASKVNDGGFYYTPAAGGSSQAGETPSGGLRSYGSMTYAGLKSMIFAGLGPDDPRVKAAYGWIQSNYTMQENPGMGSSGLYYYYHTFAKALDAVGEPEITDSKGATHDWRTELAKKLSDEQQADGSWVNKNERWLESDPNLATAYSLLALSYCR